ncbi:hypothetical protein D3C81_1664420 [compost metagenome]
MKIHNGATAVSTVYSPAAWLMTIPITAAYPKGIRKVAIMERMGLFSGIPLFRILRSSMPVVNNGSRLINDTA